MNLHSSGIELLKVGIPKMSADSGITKIGGWSSSVQELAPSFIIYIIYTYITYQEIPSSNLPLCAPQFWNRANSDFAWNTNAGHPNDVYAHYLLHLPCVEKVGLLRHVLSLRHILSLRCQNVSNLMHCLPVLSLRHVLSLHGDKTCRKVYSLHVLSLLPQQHYNLSFPSLIVCVCVCVCARVRARTWQLTHITRHLRMSYISGGKISPKHYMSRVSAGALRDNW